MERQARQITVRSATVDDIEAMAAVHAAGWRKGFAGIVPPELTPTSDLLAKLLRERFADPGPTRIVAELGGEVSGFCNYGPTRDAGSDPGVGEIYVLFVDPAAWRQGVGRTLVRRALADLERHGCREATLWSAAGNARANRFYEALGFAPDGAEQTREQFGNVREVRFRRALGDG